MVSTLDSRPSGPGSSAGRGHCVVFLGKTLYSHSASLHPGVEMGTSELLGQPDKMLWSNLRWTSIPSRGVTVLLVASCYGNWDKLGQQLSATKLKKTMSLPFTFPMFFFAH